MHHHAGRGEDAALLSSIRRCVAIARKPKVRGITDINSGSQRILALQGPQRFGDLSGEEEICFLEEEAKVRIHVYTPQGELTRGSDADESHTLVNVMHMGHGVYRYITCMEKVVSKSSGSGSALGKLRKTKRFSAAVLSIAKSARSLSDAGGFVRHLTEVCWADHLLARCRG